MRRDRELQVKMLRNIRGDAVEYISDQHTEEQRTYNAALLVEEGLVDGRAVKSAETLQYAFVSITGLTSTGHDFLDKLDLMLESGSPVEDKFQMDVFISHSSRDADLASELVALLQLALALPSGQIRCTSVNGYRLSTGADTNEQLRQEVRMSRVLIGLLTPTSIASTYVLFELGARWGAGLPLFPVLGGGASSSVLQGPLVGINAVNLTDVSQLYQLLEDVGRELGIKLEASSALTKHIERVVNSAGQESSQKSPSLIKSAISADKDSKFRISDPAAHILRAVALLGEEAYAIEEIQLKSGEPILKVRHYLDMLIALTNLEIIEIEGVKRYRLTYRGRLDAAEKLL